MPSFSNCFTEQALPRGAVADFVFAAPEGCVLALAGIDGDSLRILLDQVDSELGTRRALVARITAGPTTEATIEHVLDSLADTARRLWPTWFNDVSFAACRNDTLGRMAAAAIAREAAEQVDGLVPFWVEAAARLVLDDRAPRVSGILPAVELAHLVLAISRSGLIIVAELPRRPPIATNPAVTVNALEWIAQHSRTAVVALFPELPPNESPFDRILYGARRVDLEMSPANPVATGVRNEPWIAPWLGLPHPLSEVEQRLAKALQADRELGPLFAFNQFVGTVRGSRPKVDLLWAEGRLVVELDGYGSHGNRLAFMYDRHRDYELTLSGYAVLRLANDEIEQDLQKAVEKIRDLVKLCRMRTVSEG
jgi:very-short-patch-repair endonuclease